MCPGCSGALSDRHIPELPRMSDEYGGPSGRRCDYVGAMMATKTEDMARIAPLWFEYTKRVRDDPHAWNSTDDPEGKPGEKIWVAEMYGYAFAAAKVGVRHVLSRGLQNYPAYSIEDTATVDIANLLHYTLEFTFLNYTFNKHDHDDFSYTACPIGDEISWQDYGVFPHPPHPSSIVGEDARAIYDQWLGIYVINALNKALCERHLNKCQPVVGLERACEIVNNISRALSFEEERLYKSGALCTDIVPECKALAQKGKCSTLYDALSSLCRVSCGFCTVITDYSEARNDHSNSLQVEQIPDGEEIIANVSRMLPLRLLLLFPILICAVYVIRSQHQKQTKSN